MKITIESNDKDIGAVMAHLASLPVEATITTHHVPLVGYPPEIAAPPLRPKRLPRRAVPVAAVAPVTKPKRVRKPRAAPPVRRDTADKERLILAAVDKGAATMAEIASATNLPKGAMRSVIESLKARSLLHMSNTKRFAVYGVTPEQAAERDAARNPAQVATTPVKAVKPHKRAPRRVVVAEPSAGGEE